MTKGKVKETWKFLMAFAMKGGAGSRLTFTFFIYFCLKTISNHSLTAKARFAHNLSHCAPPKYLGGDWG